jgi:hypothetical protein
MTVMIRRRALPATAAAGRCCRGMTVVAPLDAPWNRAREVPRAEGSQGLRANRRAGPALRRLPSARHPRVRAEYRTHAAAPHPRAGPGGG